MGPRPSGVAEVAVVGLLDTRWQLNVDPSESHWSVLDPGAWEGTGMDGPGSRWAGSDEWAGPHDDGLPRRSVGTSNAESVAHSGGAPHGD